MIQKNFRFSAVISLIIANVIGFMLQMSISGFTESFMLVSADIYTRPWILLTSMFLHGSPMHLFFNMYALLLFGTLIERKIGTKRFLGIYFVSGLLAAFIPFYHAALGASGAIMGILGMTIMLFPDLKVLFLFFIPMKMRTAGIIFAAIDLFGLVAPLRSGIAHYAHLVGLACGLAYGYYLIKKRREFMKQFSSNKKKKTRKNSSNYGDTIELSESDVENYLRYGRL